MTTKEELTARARKAWETRRAKLTAKAGPATEPVTVSKGGWTGAPQVKKERRFTIPLQAPRRDPVSKEAWQAFLNKPFREVVPEEPMVVTRIWPED